MRPCFYDFPDDARAWQRDAQYMYGAKYLVAPILNPGQTEVQVYLPGGASWELWGEKGKVYEGGTEITVASPLDSMPVLAVAARAAEALFLSPWR